jgi:cytochrome c6
MPPGQASPAAAGKVVFTSYCQGCHGVKGEGKVPGTPVFSAAWQKKEASDAPLLAAITNGKGRMPAYKTRLSEQQVKDVLAYVRTLGK